MFFRSDIVTQVNNSIAFFLLADETADIQGKVQIYWSSIY